MRRAISMVTEPNVVPMIDVLLVLLIIFMLTVVAPVRRAYDIQLPQPAAGSGGGAAVVLSVVSGPRYILNGQTLASDRLEAELRDLFAPRVERVLFVRGDRGLRYQDVVHAFDAARGAGIAVTAMVPGSAR